MAFWLLGALVVPTAAAFAAAKGDGGGSGGGNHGVGFFVFFPERQQERKSSRWTLSDWMSTKKTIAEQNIWLARHSNKIPVDVTYSLDTRKAGRLGNELEFFLGWLGLRARYEFPWSRLDAVYDPLAKDPAAKSGEAGLAMRLVGGNPQNTSLTVKALFEYDHVYGMGSSVTGPYSGWTFEPELQIYLAPWLGARGAYRYRLTKTNLGDENLHLGGHSWWAGAFVEANSVRLEVAYESRLWEFKTTAGSVVDRTDVGVIVTRLRFFF